ncbi:MAG: zinc ribbon domain-containing protein [Phycisphaerales bacterium]|nr:zinc ribbon domain-containing protein [Phycisphaerales bacterium]
MTEAQSTAGHPITCNVDHCGHVNPPGSLFCAKCGADIVVGRGLKDAMKAAGFFLLLAVATFFTVRAVMQHYDAAVRAQAEKAGVLDQLVDKPPIVYPDIPGKTPPKQ